MSRYTFTIGDDNAVSIFDTENPTETGAPNILQSLKPAGGKPFENEEEAQAWAELIIDSLLNPEKYAPPVIEAEVVEETPAES